MALCKPAFRVVSVLLAFFGHSVLAAQAQPVGSLKKGLGVPVHADGVWLHNVSALNARWFYSWGGDEPVGIPKGVEFVPMDWGYYGNQDNSHGKHLLKVAAQPGVKYLLGFNEPDGKDQANISVDTALSAWPLLMQTGLILGSPACVHADDDWMKSFMASAQQKGYRVDFICVHWYGWSDAQSFLSYLALVHNLYHLPIWVTEFAPADWSGHRGISPSQVAEFMRVVLPAMEKLDYVQRYAWFSGSVDDAALGASALFNKDGSLTDLGRLYASY